MHKYFILLFKNGLFSERGLLSIPGYCFYLLKCKNLFDFDNVVVWWDITLCLLYLRKFLPAVIMPHIFSCSFEVSSIPTVFKYYLLRLYAVLILCFSRRCEKHKLFLWKNNSLKNMNDLVSSCAVLCCLTCKGCEKNVSEH